MVPKVTQVINSFCSRAALLPRPVLPSVVPLSLLLAGFLFAFDFVFLFFFLRWQFSLNGIDSLLGWVTLFGIRDLIAIGAFRLLRFRLVPSIGSPVSWLGTSFVYSIGTFHFISFIFSSFLYLFLWFSPRSIFGAASRRVQEVCAIKLSGYGFMELYWNWYSSRVVQVVHCSADSIAISWPARFISLNWSNSCFLIIHQSSLRFCCPLRVPEPINLFATFFCLLHLCISHGGRRHKQDMRYSHIFFAKKAEIYAYL